MDTKETMEIWRRLNTTCRELSRVHPLFFGPRLQIFDSVVEKPLTMRQRLFQNPLTWPAREYARAMRVREMEGHTQDLSGKVLHVAHSPGVAAIKVAEDILVTAEATGMSDQLVFLVGLNVLLYRPDWVASLDDRGVAWASMSNAGIWNSLPTLISALMWAKKGAKTVFVALHDAGFGSLGGRLREVEHYLFVDRLAWLTINMIFRRSRPRALISESDMVAGSHACHALANRMGIPNYVLQHGTLSLYHGFHHPGTRTLVWGERNKVFLKDVAGVPEDVLVFGSHKLQDISRVKGDECRERTRKRLGIALDASVVLVLSDKPYVPSRFRGQSFYGALKKGYTTLLDRLRPRVQIIVRPHPDENLNLFWKEVLKNGDRIITNKEASLEEAILASDVCVTSISTTGYESMLLGRATVFFLPMTGEDLAEYIGLSVPECTVHKEEEFVDVVRRLVKDEKFRRDWVNRQNAILPELFAGPDHMEQVYKSLFSEKLEKSDVRVINEI